MMMVVMVVVMFSLLMVVMVLGMVTLFGNCLIQGTQHLGRRGRRRSR